MTADSRLTPPIVDDAPLSTLDAILVQDDAVHLLARVSGWLADVALSSQARDEVDDAA